MKVVLVTSFEERFLEQDTLPELARRGIEVVSRFEAKDARSYDFEHFKRTGVALVLHMHEVGPHCSSETLSRLCREAGLPIKALSRKKASWTFLPAPKDGGPPSAKPEAALPNTPTVERRRGLANHSGLLAAVSGATAAYESERLEKAILKLADGYLHASLDSDIPMPPHVEKFLKETSFNRKEARLRDVVMLVLGHNISDPERVIKAVLDGREQGVFPRLARIKKDEIPKLVRSIIEQENRERGVHNIRLDPKDRERFESIGLTEPNLASPEDTRAMAAMIAAAEEESMQNGAKVVPMGKSLNPHIASAEDELAKLRAQLAEVMKEREAEKALLEDLGKLVKARDAFKTLIKLGMMTPLEAAEKLFGEAL